LLNNAILYERSAKTQEIVAQTSLTSAGATSAVWSKGILVGDSQFFALFWDASGTGDDVDIAPDMKFSFVSSLTSAAWYYKYNNSNSRTTIIASMGDGGKRYQNLSALLQPTLWMKFKFEVNTDGPSTNFNCSLLKIV